jgi:hypothetical protein
MTEILTDDEVRWCISFIENMRSRGVIGNELASAKEKYIDMTQAALHELLSLRQQNKELQEKIDSLERYQRDEAFSLNREIGNVVAEKDAKIKALIEAGEWMYERLLRCDDYSTENESSRSAWRKAKLGE